MQRRLIGLTTLCALSLVANIAWAQTTPAADDNSTMQRITPLDQDPKAAGILTTHPVADAPSPGAVTPAAPAPVPSPTKTDATAPTPAPSAHPQNANAPLTPPAPSFAAPISNLPTKSPFGHATPTGPAIPSGPHETVATPVGTVDSVEVSEPAPPTPVAPGADPAAEDPAAPTEFTSPMFDNTTDNGAPRKIVIRVLNKVTAQSALFKAKPGETIQFGRLQINAEMCRVSSPNSQNDFAGLLDIKEQLPGKEGIKPLFHGWMYASSPSIAALEHPIYDVTMISCDIATPAPKEDTAPKKKSGNSKKK